MNALLPKPNEKSDPLLPLKEENSRLTASIVQLDRELRSATEKLAIQREEKPHDYKHFKSEAMNPERGKTYMNETVEMDGKSFSDCKFINAKLMYHGTGPAEIRDCDVDGTFMVETDNAAASTLMSLYSHLQAIPNSVMVLGDRDRKTGNMLIRSRSETPPKKTNKTNKTNKK